MWRRSNRECVNALRRFHAGIRRKIDDEGDWRFAKEWWGADSEGHTLFLSRSDHGNGVVTVVSHPSSTPERSEWPKTEKLLQQRYAEVNGVNERFRISGYEWRSLKFNHETRQSTVKVMTGRAGSGTDCTTFAMQLSHCLATPYLKSMVSAGLSAISCSGFDLCSAVHGNTPMRILCIGHGGGSLPLFLSSKIKGAIVDSVEIDPVVILASEAMGFPSLTNRSSNKPQELAKVLWKDIQGRLLLHLSDAEDFILKTTNIYDMVFIDAYDGDDIFPSKLWDPQTPFLSALNNQLHPNHGTVVVNLHSDVDVRNSDGSLPSVFQQVLPMGKYVSSVCQSYKDLLVGYGNGGNFADEGQGVVFTVAVPQLCNSSLVASKGFRIGGRVLTRDSVLNSLASKCDVVENVLELPFSCLQYLMTGFVLVD